MFDCVFAVLIVSFPLLLDLLLPDVMDYAVNSRVSHASL